jgi:hypothetical protein
VLILRTNRIQGNSENFQNSDTDVVVLRGGMDKKQLEKNRNCLTAIPSCDERVLLATGRYVG